jgi:hypothetical protein
MSSSARRVSSSISRRVGERLLLEALRRLARAGDDLLGLLARLAQALPVFLEQLVGLVPRALGGVDRLVDRLAPAVERLADAREREPLQQEQREAERDQRPDHQPHVRGDEEVAAVAGGDGVGRAHQPLDRKKAIRPKTKA